MDYLVLFLFGLTIGSFLNVVIYRLRTGKSPVRGRSYCDHCHHQISWYDNIPLLSYLLLRGKCRHCQKTIAIDYPIIEALTAIQFVWVYWLLKVNFQFFGQVEGFYSLSLLSYWLLLFTGSLAIAIYDFKYLLIPDLILVPLVVLALLRLTVSQQWSVVPTAFGASAFLFVLWWFTRGKGLGVGDIKLAFLMGLVLGWPQILVAFMIAFLTGSVVGVILVLVRKKSLKDKIAFGPFLILGMLLSKLWGWPLWQWYINKL
jgi:prepilin signal peptidase PulO-like enzyme (type II secretory pathway)